MDTFSSIFYKGSLYDIIESDETEQDQKKYYDYFWITFTNSIYNHIPESIKNDINIYLKKIKELHDNKDYSNILLEINNFLDLNINYIIGYLYFINEDNLLRLTKTNIHRFIKIYPSFQLKSIEYAILSALITHDKHNKKNNNSEMLLESVYDYFSLCIKSNKYQIGCIELSTQINLDTVLYTIINDCIQVQSTGLLNNLLDFINISYFFKDNISKSSYKNTKAPKLFKMIELKYPDEIIELKYKNII